MKTKDDHYARLLRGYSRRREEIIALHKAGVPQVVIARRYAISAQRVCQIIAAAQ